MDKDWFSELTLTIDNDKELLDKAIDIYIGMLRSSHATGLKALLISAGYPSSKIVPLSLYQEVAFHYLTKVLVDHTDKVDISKVYLISPTSSRYHVIRKVLSATAHIVEYPSYLLDHYMVFPEQGTEKPTNLECIQEKVALVKHNPELNNTINNEVKTMFYTDSSKAFDKVTGLTVYGVDIKKLTECQAIDAIRKVNLEIDNLESVQVESKRITKMLTDLKKQKAEIVKLLDSGKLAS